MNNEIVTKDYHLKDSKTFCILPWIHIHSQPTGAVHACCIARNSVGNSFIDSLKDLVNCDNIKNLRLNMLEGQENPTCQTCYDHEKEGIESSRQNFNKRFRHYYDEVLELTDANGYLNDFRMRFFDFRFNNICNFKCRTCCEDYSSSWEQENTKRNVSFLNYSLRNNDKKSVNEILEHIPYMEEAYFAGGETLLTEEHYILLEEMIKLGRTDIKLIYNSNISTLKYKNKNILGLWDHFSKPIEVYASIDHVKEKAEYIRHGTNWGEIETNIKLLKSLENINFALQTVLSIFNYYSLDEFYNYLIENNLYVPNGPANGLFCASHPVYFSSRSLPLSLKETANIKVSKLLEKMYLMGFSDHHRTLIQNSINWTNSADTWNEQKDNFQKEIKIIDKIRGESFIKTFPELSSLMD